MQFLRSLFWVIVAVAMLIFAVQNNGVVTVNLWGGLQADVKLWLLVLGPLLVGFLPTWIFGRVSLWQQKRQGRVAAERAQMLPTYEMPSVGPAANAGPTGNTQPLPSAVSPTS
jgi:uncharacterized integral membrane protein